MESILGTLQRKTRSSHCLHDERDRIEYESGALWNIDRQTSDQARRDYSGRQRRRPLSSVFIEIRSSEERIRIGTSNTNIRETLRDEIQNLLGIYLIDLETQVNRDDVDEEKFVAELNSEVDESDENRVLAAEFHRTNVSPSLPIKISKQSYERDIRPIIKSIDEDVVTVEIGNVSKLWVEIDGVPGTINVQQSPQDSFIRLSSNLDTNRDRHREKFKNKFQDAFGVPVDKKIPLHWITGDRLSFISSILKNPSSYDSRKYPNQELIRDIANLGVIELTRITSKKCSDCGNSPIQVKCDFASSGHSYLKISS